MSDNETTKTTETSETSEIKQTVYKVVRLDFVQEKIAKLARRAARLGLPTLSCEKVGEHTEWQVEFRNAYGEVETNWISSRSAQYELTGVTRTVHHLVLHGASIVKLAGWTFIAVIDHSLGEEAALIHRSPDVEFPTETLKMYAERGSQCDHCRHTRMRKRTFVLRHEDGSVVQVGSSCLKDFLGHSAEGAMIEMELGALAREAMDDSFDLDAAKAPKQYDLVEFLAWTAQEIREHGWVSRAKAHDSQGIVATADRVLESLAAYHRQRKE